VPAGPTPRLTRPWWCCRSKRAQRLDEAGSVTDPVVRASDAPVAVVGPNLDRSQPLLAPGRCWWRSVHRGYRRASSRPRVGWSHTPASMTMARVISRKVAAVLGTSRRQRALHTSPGGAVRQTDPARAPGGAGQRGGGRPVVRPADSRPRSGRSGHGRRVRSRRVTMERNRRLVLPCVRVMSRRGDVCGGLAEIR
jgi:hypothetical protein